MTAPRQTTAAYLRPSASRRATTGISNDPGTRTTSTASSATPWRRKASSAPATSASTTTALKRAATTAKRPGGEETSPSYTVGIGRSNLRSAGGRRQRQAGAVRVVRLALDHLNPAEPARAEHPVQFGLRRPERLRRQAAERVRLAELLHPCPPVAAGLGVGPVVGDVVSPEE